MNKELLIGSPVKIINRNALSGVWENKSVTIDSEDKEVFHILRDAPDRLQLLDSLLKSTWILTSFRSSTVFRLEVKCRIYTAILNPEDVEVIVEHSQILSSISDE
jgi:hypothetical protein